MLFRIAAENQFGSSPFTVSEEMLARDPIRAPGPPRDLEVADIDRYALTVTWNKPERDGGCAVSGMYKYTYTKVFLMDFF